MGVNSAEYKTLKKHTNELCLTVKADLIGLGGALFADDLITKEQNDDLSNQTHARRDRAAKLFGLILDKVELDPQNYHTFIGILERRDLAQYGRIVRQLQETILDSGGATVTTPTVQQTMVQQASSPTTAISNKHLGLIADSMHEWEGPVAEELLLAPADVANIKTKYPIQLTLQTREALQKWKQSNGAAATYNNLIGVFERAGYRGYADTVRSIFASGPPSIPSSGAGVVSPTAPAAAQPKPSPSPPAEQATSRNCSGNNIDSAHFIVIKWKDDQGEMHKFRLMDKMKDKWEEIADLLHIPKDELSAKYGQDTAKCCRAVLDKWMKAPPPDYPATWDGLMELLDDVELGGVLPELKTVLGKAKIYIV